MTSTALFKSIAPLAVIGSLFVVSCSSSQPATQTTNNERRTTSTEDRAAITPTFARDIGPIIHDHCSACHQPDGLAPFPLVSFQDVSKRANQIAAVTSSRFMPPWLPADNGNGPHITGARRLTDNQVKLIQQWAANGTPQGDPKFTPPVPQFNSDWPLGQPDLILRMDEPFDLAADGLGVVRTLVFPVNLEEDQFIKAIDFRPSNPRAAHHAAFLMDTTGSARMLDHADPGPGYASMGDIGFNLAGSYGVWSPAQFFIEPAGGTQQQRRAIGLLPEGIARPLPNQCDLVAEVHFQPTGKPERITAQLGLYLTKDHVKRFAVPITLGTFFIDIPPGEREYTVIDSFTLPTDAHLLSIAPRAHYVCKRVRVHATLPDGRDIQLLRIDDWDFNWQQEYRYDNPMCLQAGTEVRMEFTYDNSADNLRNPSHPPQRVRTGFQPTDEMGLTFLYLVADDNAGQMKLEQAHQEKLIERMNEAKARRAAQQ